MQVGTFLVKSSFKCTRANMQACRVDCSNSHNPHGSQQPVPTDMNSIGIITLRSENHPSMICPCRPWKSSSDTSSAGALVTSQTTALKLLYLTRLGRDQPQMDHQLRVTPQRVFWACKISTPSFVHYQTCAYSMLSCIKHIPVQRLHLDTEILSQTGTT